MQAESAGLRRILHEHEAIRADLKRIDDSCNNLIEQAQSDQSELLKERMANPQTLLYLRDGIKQHIARDEAALQPLVGRFSMDSIVKEHKEIEQEVERAISLTGRIVEKEMSQEELSRWGSDFMQAIHRIHELIVAHIAREDAIVELLRKNLEGQGSGGGETR